MEGRPATDVQQPVYWSNRRPNLRDAPSADASSAKAPRPPYARDAIERHTERQRAEARNRRYAGARASSYARAKSPSENGVWWGERDGQAKAESSSTLSESQVRRRANAEAALRRVQKQNMEAEKRCADERELNAIRAQRHGREWQAFQARVAGIPNYYSSPVDGAPLDGVYDQSYLNSEASYTLSVGKFPDHPNYYGPHKLPSPAPSSTASREKPKFYKRAWKRFKAWMKGRHPDEPVLNSKKDIGRFL